MKPPSSSDAPEKSRGARAEAAGFLPTRLSLIERVKNLEDEGAWTEFYNTYRPLIENVARRKGLSHEEAEEVVQETMKSIRDGIHKFEPDPGRASFKTWLLTITERRIIDAVRRRPRYEASRVHRPAQPDGEAPSTATEEGLAGLPQAWDEEWDKMVLEAASRKLRKKIDAADHQIFHHYVVLDLDAGDVAARLGVAAWKVYKIKFKHQALFRRLVQQVVEEMG